MTVPAGTGALEATQQQILQQLQGTGGGESVSIADGANVAQGTTTDVAWTSGAGTEIALLKKLVAQLATTLGVSGTVTANAGTGNFTVAQATGTNLHAVIDSGSTTAVTQATGTNLHSVVDSGSITANAGTNLNTSLLALETGGNLASIKTDADSIATNTSSTATNTSNTATNTSNINTHAASIDTATAASKTDLDTIVTQTATPNVSDRWARQVGQVDIARVLGATLSISNPNITEGNIQNAIRNGQGYTAVARNTTGGSAIIGLSIFNASNSGKNILIYSARPVVNTSMSPVNGGAYLTTTDPALGTTVTPLNNKAGGSASVTTCSTTNTNVSPAGTLFSGFGLIATTPYELFTSGRSVLLPSGSANGFAIYVTANTIAWVIDIAWVEF